MVLPSPSRTNFSIHMTTVTKCPIESPAESRQPAKKISSSQLSSSAGGNKAVPMPARYVVVTPARNESSFIELTISSMAAQTVLPLKWVIVSDGSTDGTDEIVARHASLHSWIELVSLPARPGRDFAGKVRAFNVGLERVADISYDTIVSLDADISFDPDYFSFLLGKLEADHGLGLVGTPFREVSGESYDYRFVSVEHVSGCCQVFRRQCFEAVGGYIPIRGGSIDHVAVITARMKGWKTRTFTEMYSTHHRPIGTANHSVTTAKFRMGLKDYAIGNHPLWELCRVAHQMTKPPLCIGGVCLGTGYLWGLLRRAKRPVSRELIEFHQREQIRRLRTFLQRGARFFKPAPKAGAPNMGQGQAD
jgi:biofilm PGA synthesis N-glycosyltransferase PgaC